MKKGSKWRSMRLWPPLSGTAEIHYSRSVLPIEKRAKEKFIAEEFLKTKSSASDVRINPDDSFGKPDIFCNINGKETSIQLTQLIVRHGPKSSDIVEKINTKLIYEISSQVIVTHPLHILILIPSNEENTLLKINSKEIKILAEVIVKAIEFSQISPSMSELEQFSKEGKKVNITPIKIPDNINSKIKAILIQRLEENVNIYRTIRNNLIIDFNFNMIIMSEELLVNLIEEIYLKKEDSNSDILLIWTCDENVLTLTDEVVFILQERFEKTNFKQVFFFQFWPGEELFEKNKRIFQIK